jgi:hypothetical protein
MRFRCLYRKRQDLGYMVLHSDPTLRVGHLPDYHSSYIEEKKETILTEIRLCLQSKLNEMLILRCM